MSAPACVLLALAVAASSAGAQRVLLELRPRAGDTMHMELEQVTELSTARAGAAPTTTTTTLRMFSRAIVESNAAITSVILAITDSVHVASSDAHATALGDQAERELVGRSMRLRLWPDGTVTLHDGAASVPREVNELVSVMPAAFPVRSVAVGERWIREMPIPAGQAIGIPAGTVIRTRFRLDSVTADGTLAFVSLTGTVEPARSGANVDALDGSVNGSLVVNRKRGWLAASSFLVVLRSTLQRAGQPVDSAMRFRVKLTQQMHVRRPAVVERRR